jgi:hypothetical protein
MKVQEVKRRIQLQEWAAQVSACEKSGLPVKRWCEEVGIAKKTYYYRRKRVQEELLEAISGETEIVLSGTSNLTKYTSGKQLGLPVCTELQPPSLQGNPEYAALPIPKNSSAAVTVWLGDCAVDIHNSADDAIVEQVLRVVSRL